MTVLRDGRLRGTSAVADISDADLLALIVGRTLEATFPPKHRADADDEPLLRVEGLSGNGFDDVSFTAREGEIVGIAGVVGNGQPALLRALAGLDRARGTVDVGGVELSRRALLDERRLHAGRPADRGSDDGPERARERGHDRARPAHGRARSSAGAARSTLVERELSDARRQGAVARGAGLGALGRQPAEGRDGARDALRPDDPRRRRADAGRRRRRARRDLPHPPRGRRPRRARRRRVERRARSSRACATA